MAQKKTFGFPLHVHVHVYNMNKCPDRFYEFNSPKTGLGLNEWSESSMFITAFMDQC